MTLYELACIIASVFTALGGFVSIVGIWNALTNRMTAVETILTVHAGKHDKIEDSIEKMSNKLDDLKDLILSQKQNS
jgi:hypothetical protein